MRTVKILFTLSALLLLGRVARAQDATMDVVKYDLQLDFSNLESLSMRGVADIYFIPLRNDWDEAVFDLHELQVDSVSGSREVVEFYQADTLLHISFKDLLPMGDTVRVRIYYGGQPKNIGSGGFYFQDGYGFNHGESGAAPFTSGRTWFPCVDNFTDKAHYDMHVTVKTGLKAVCGGTLKDSTNNGDGTTTFNWSMRDPIQTYLASIAVGDFVLVQDVYKSITGAEIPITIYVKPALKSNVAGSFANLKLAARLFEEQFGPYVWERIGYVGVPFGGMEHATNIAYPNSCIDGTSRCDASIMAHELVHHWFGDQVTCAAGEDMWLNEGFASYCEAIFREHQYGRVSFELILRPQSGGDNAHT